MKRSILEMQFYAVTEEKNFTVWIHGQSFKLLEACSMIVLKPEQKTTRIKVCNYDSYQNDRNANETEVKRKRHQLNNENNENNKREVKTDRFTPPSLLEIQSYFSESIKEKGLTLNPETEAVKFDAHYGSINWMVGKNKMANWKKIKDLMGVVLTL